jgi:methylenetetrahydrofolate dehydrogenase (NADP+)/methenyltetrahydrofolate cyclohydrolase
MALQMDAFIPATPFGIIELLERYKIETSGKHCVVVGRSHIVGRPISILMSQKGPAGNATVTLAHSRTQNLAELTKSADIVVMALGIPEYLTAEMVKEGATIIDVGITRVADANHPKGYVIKGDVAYDEVAQKAAAITPVPGGVGPMTIAMLLKNTLFAYQRKG